RRLPVCLLFPYTTLFRSQPCDAPPLPLPEFPATARATPDLRRCSRPEFLPNLQATRRQATLSHRRRRPPCVRSTRTVRDSPADRSEEHTSELQSRENPVC